jgi:4'-phosphopantetheinyl transferase EntD
LCPPRECHHELARHGWIFPQRANSLPACRGPPRPFAFADGIAFAILAVPDAKPGDLHPQEAALISPSAVASKRTSFTLGRNAAAQALRAIGIDPAPPVLQGKGKNPLWPEQVVGSITHCEPWTICVVAKSSAAKALGVDLEDVRRVQNPDIGEVICTRSEMEWIAGSEDQLGSLIMVFSAKEAMYKAYYPFCRRYFDFTDAELAWDPAVGGFSRPPVDRPGQGPPDVDTNFACPASGWGAWCYRSSSKCR